MDSKQVKQRIESGLANCHCTVNEFSGGNDHYSVVIVSDSFEGKSLLSRHRMVMDLLKSEVDTGEVHALTMKTLTQSQWQELTNK